MRFKTIVTFIFIIAALFARVSQADVLTGQIQSFYVADNGAFVFVKISNRWAFVNNSNTDLSFQSYKIPFLTASWANSKVVTVQENGGEIQSIKGQQ